MGAVLEFLVNNYLVFLLLSLILVFALIGFLVDNKRKERKTIEETIEDEEDVIEEPEEIIELEVDEVVEQTPEKIEDEEENNQ